MEFTVGIGGTPIHVKIADETPTLIDLATAIQWAFPWSTEVEVQIMNISNNTNLCKIYKDGTIDLPTIQYLTEKEEYITIYEIVSVIGTIIETTDSAGVFLCTLMVRTVPKSIDICIGIDNNTVNYTIDPSKNIGTILLELSEAISETSKRTDIACIARLGSDKGSVLCCIKDHKRVNYKDTIYHGEEKFINKVTGIAFYNTSDNEYKSPALVLYVKLAHSKPVTK